MEADYLNITRDDFRVQEVIRVRFNEIDGQNIVFNGNYLIYADIGITEYFRTVCKLQAGPYFHQYGTEIREEHCEILYHGYAALDDQITIAARVAEFGYAHFTLHCAMFRGEERLTDVAIRYGHIDIDSKKSVILPGSFIAEVWRFERIKPAQ